MTHKILLPNGDYVCRASVRAWTPKEEANEEMMAARKTFMTRVHDALGPACVINDFDDVEELTPEFEYYADEDETGFEGTPDEPLPPTPEVGDNYVGARLNLPRGDGQAMGRVVKRARNNDGNTIGRAHQNPILDTREYVAEFEDGTTSELAANVIAQSMYAQCDPDGNTYLLFDSIVGHRKGTSALSAEDQFITNEKGRKYVRKSTAG